MNVVGIVAEYNPFHNGHLYQLQEATRRTDAEYVICIMSGHFLQRGEPALVDKWARAAMALASGADIVFELPYVYCCQTAETFASGAVALLESTGVVTHIAFGSECPNLDAIHPLIPILAEEPAPYRRKLKESLSQGLSYPAARQQALERYLDLTVSHTDSNAIKQILSKPNSILGIEYLKALYQSNSKMIPVLIPRTGAAYHDTQLQKGTKIASATAIRQRIQENWPQRKKTALRMIAHYMPDTSLDRLDASFNQGRGPIFPSHFEDMLNYALRLHSARRLADIADIREGLENRIMDAAACSTTWEDLLASIKSKRYTQTTLQRILIQILVQYTKEDARLVSDSGPQYLRLLGFSQAGQKLLKLIRKEASIPVVDRLAPYERELHQVTGIPHLAAAHRMMQLDRLTTDLYVLGFSNPLHRNSEQDYTTAILSPYTAGRFSHDS